MHFSCSVFVRTQLMERGLRGTAGARVQPRVVVEYRIVYEPVPILRQLMAGGSVWESNRSFNHAMRTIVQVSQFVRTFVYLLRMYRYYSISPFPFPQHLQTLVLTTGNSHPC